MNLMESKGKPNQPDQDNFARMFFTKLHTLPVPGSLTPSVLCRTGSDGGPWSQQVANVDLGRL